MSDSITREDVKWLKDAYKSNYVKGGIDFVDNRKQWWIPSVEEQLFANKEKIHTAMLFASTMEDHRLLFEFYNTMVHPEYVWGNWGWLEEWTDYVFDWLVAESEKSSLPLDKIAINALINTVGSRGHPFLNRGEKHEGEKFVDKIQQIATESLLKRKDEGKGVRPTQKNILRFLTVLENEWGLVFSRDGDIAGAKKRYEVALNMSIKTGWYQVYHSIVSSLAGLYSNEENYESGKKLLRDALNVRLGFQPRRNVIQHFELARMERDLEYRLKRLKEAKDLYFRYGLNDQNLLSNLLKEIGLVKLKMNNRKAVSTLRYALRIGQSYWNQKTVNEIRDIIGE